MPTQVQFRRGTASENDNFTGAEGELSINLENNSLRVHDGSTAGGFELAKNDLSNIRDVGVITATAFVGDGSGLTGIITTGGGGGGSLDQTLAIGNTSSLGMSVGVITATSFNSTSGGTPTIGAATTVNINAIKVAISTDITVGRNVNVSGIVTATNGFISVGNTTPIQISLVGNKLTFTAVGIGSTTLTLF
jgi:hypothetical protein